MERPPRITRKVTGGTVRGARGTALGETRGVAVEGGTEHRLAEGDVLVVPAGVPHHFAEVSDPFLYLVAKVRG